MKAFTIAFTYADGPLPTLDRLKKEAAKRNITYTTTEGHAGTFSAWGVVGTFSLEPDRMEITITDKPILLPQAVVRKAIESWRNSL